MKRFCKFILLLGISCISASGAAAQSAGELMTEVEYLAGPELEGRGFGTPGAGAGAFYIFRQFRNAGLRTSFQSFSRGGRTGHNVIGVTPGWFRSYIDVGAYFDGVGKCSDIPQSQNLPFFLIGVFHTESFSESDIQIVEEVVYLVAVFFCDDVDDFSETQRDGRADSHSDD